MKGIRCGGTLMGRELPVLMICCVTEVLPSDLQSTVNREMFKVK